jgi:hypothetical protein
MNCLVCLDYVVDAGRVKIFYFLEERTGRDTVLKSGFCFSCKADV